MDLKTIQEAAERIRPRIIRTPLLRLSALDAVLGCQVYVKAECMQKTGAFKLRGAMNRALSLTRAELDRGIVTASSGNHGRAIAYAARMLGTSAAVVMPRTAPQVKVDAIRALGAEVVLCKASERFRIAEELCEERKATLIPPFNDEYVMAGQGTIGLELMEQQPDLDAVVVPVSGGGLFGGVSTAVKALSPNTKVYGAEPELLPRYSKSLAAGKPVTVEQKHSVADALAAQTPGPLCFPYVKENVELVAPVSEDAIRRAMKLLLMEGKLLAEPASCIGIGAVLQGRIPVSPEDKVCFVISGGNVGFETVEALRDVAI